MVLLRRLLGDTLRRTRQRQQRTLREVSSAARVSLGYLSEVERGQKEASSELLSAICDALDVRLSDVLREVSTALDAELAPVGESALARVVVDPVVIDRSSLPATPAPDLPPFESIARAVSASAAGFGQPTVSDSLAAVTVAA
jgi:transcriptional regulator with XRE-family HTH domain